MTLCEHPSAASYFLCQSRLHALDLSSNALADAGIEALARAMGESGVQRLVRKRSGRIVLVWHARETRDASCGHGSTGGGLLGPQPATAVPPRALLA